MFLKRKLKGLAIWKMLIQSFQWVFHGCAYTVLIMRVFFLLEFKKKGLVKYVPVRGIKPHLWGIKTASGWKVMNPGFCLCLGNFKESEVRHIVM